MFIVTGKALMKKWRNIKDSFVKASKNMKNMKSGSGAKHKSPYTYYNILLFLKDSTMVNETESDIANDLSQDHDGPYETSQNVASQKRRKKSNNEDVIGQQLVSVLNKNLEYKKETENDEDKLFLLSLLKEFKKIPESNKLEARCEIIRAIRNAQQPSFHYSYPNTQFDRGYRNHMYESEYAGRGYQTLDSDFTGRGYESRLNNREPTTTSYQHRQNLPGTSTHSMDTTEEATQESASQDDASLMSELFNSP